jgi:5-methylcytosine-specific restriction enzyme subunit McrC
MHALCRFFLEHIGPTHQVGDRRMLPVLVDMEKLFEIFVVEWMKQHVSDRYAVRGQETIQMQLGQPVLIKLDIVVDDLLSGQTALVLDTKYKNPDQVALADIHQVVSYAEAKHCRQAVLVYPVPSSKPIDGPWGASIHVKSHSFRLEGNLDEAGGDFLKQLSKSSGLELQALPVVEYMH